MVGIGDVVFAAAGKVFLAATLVGLGLEKVAQLRGVIIGRPDGAPRSWNLQFDRVVGHVMVASKLLSSGPVDELLPAIAGAPGCVIGRGGATDLDAEGSSDSDESKDGSAAAGEPGDLNFGDIEHLLIAEDVQWTVVAGRRRSGVQPSSDTCYIVPM